MNVFVSPRPFIEAMISEGLPKYHSDIRLSETCSQAKGKGRDMSYVDLVVTGILSLASQFQFLHSFLHVSCVLARGTISFAIPVCCDVVSYYSL